MDVCIPSSSSRNMSHSQHIIVGNTRLVIEDVLHAARRSASFSLSSDPVFVQRIRKGAAFLERMLADGGIVYGVNTGYGDSCTVSVPGHLISELPLHLTRYHGCGMGEYLDD